VLEASQLLVVQLLTVLPQQFYEPGWYCVTEGVVHN
jgi:hypothetical protein